MTEEEYLQSRGAFFMAGADAALHRTPGGFPKGVREKYTGQVQATMQANNERRIQLRKEYAAKVANGEIVPPTRLERLIQTARGHDDLQATQAARRLLRKQNVDWSDKTI